jgi:hypothetical protein
MCIGVMIQTSKHGDQTSLLMGTTMNDPVFLRQCDSVCFIINVEQSNKLLILRIFLVIYVWLVPM